MGKKAFTMQTEQEIWRRAFHLAYFIHCDLRTAFCVMVHGMELAALKARQQNERTGANLMKMNAAQLFQIGLLQASEFYERRQEFDQFGNGKEDSMVEAKKSLLEQFIDLAFSIEGLTVSPPPLSLNEEDLTIRYIKHLVQVTVSRNAYQVMVGISQFLYRHGVKEMGHIHLLIDPDLKRGGVSGKSYKTSRKRIWNELNHRFSGLLVLRGKGRFQPQKRTLSLFGLVNDSLEHLALWGTEHYLFTDEPHQAHALIHPACYERVIKQLQIKDPTANLTIPHFLLPANNNPTQRPNRRQAPDLAEEQLRLLQEIYDKLSKRRKESEPMLLSIRVDGVEQAQFNSGAEHSLTCRLPASARMIEVYSCESDGNLLLASCWLVELEESETQHSVVETRAEGGQVIRFEVSVVSEESVTVEIRYRETKPWRWLALEWRRVSLWFKSLTFASKPAAGWAMAIGLLLIGTLLFVWLRQRPTEVPVIVKRPAPTVVPLPTTAPSAPSPLLADNYPKPRTGYGKSNSDRSSEARGAGISLSAVERVFIELPGKDEFQSHLREALNVRMKQSALKAEEIISSTTDAVIQVKNVANKRQIQVQLVNREGEVLWQGSFKREDAEPMAERIIAKLVKAIETERQKQTR